MLAQDAGGSVVDILWYSFVLLLVLGGLIIAGVIIRRWYATDEEPGHDAAGLTLADLRQMHREGQLNDEEFEKAKGSIIDRSRAMLDEPGEGSQDAPRAGVHRGPITEPHEPRDRPELRRDAGTPVAAANPDHPTPTPDTGADAPAASPPPALAKGEEPIPDPTQGGRRPDLNHPL